MLQGAKTYEVGRVTEIKKLPYLVELLVIVTDSAGEEVKVSYEVEVVN